ncbi:MAG: hypothetical protein LBC70_03320 [Chitinispirillales bacterium]|jgi:hypothetical protein|nr:hypothetical protein [Chitinispirillales bacterium]
MNWFLITLVLIAAMVLSCEREREAAPSPAQVIDTGRVLDSLKMEISEAGRNVRFLKLTTNTNALLLNSVKDSLARLDMGRARYNNLPSFEQIRYRDIVWGLHALNAIKDTTNSEKYSFVRQKLAADNAFDEARKKFNRVIDDAQHAADKYGEDVSREIRHTIREALEDLR